MLQAPILIINGSPSVPSRTAALCDHLAGALSELGLPAEQLALNRLPAEPLLRARAEAPGVREAVAAVEAAPALVLATPIYKAAYSGLLKIFLDLLPQFAFAGKTVLPVATGGSLAHVLAIDYALRPVLASLGARHVVGGFFVLDRLLGSAPGQHPLLDTETRTKLLPVLEAFVDSVRRHAH